MLQRESRAVVKSDPMGNGAFHDANGLRAANLVWNAAHDYSIEPPHLFFDDAEAPLPYENTVTGLIFKCFDVGAIRALAATWEGDYRADELDRLLWLAFGEEAAKREMPRRPALASLHASFLENLDGEGRALLELLARPAGSPGIVTQPEIERRILRVAEEHYGFDGHVVRPVQATLHLGVGIAPRLVRKTADQQSLPASFLQKGEPAAQRGSKLKGVLRDARDKRRQSRAGEERRDIEERFGPPIVPEHELRELEHRLCTGNHAGSRLWVADGSCIPQASATREAREMTQAARVQIARTRAFFSQNRRLCEDAATALAYSLRDRMKADAAIWERRQPHGTLDAGRAWRVDIADDTRIFRRKVPLDQIGLSVLILLDGSGSRSDDAPEIATQAWVIAEGLHRAGARVHTCSFTNVGDYTVFRRFEHAGEDGLPAIMHYFATGMNRDGLALRAAGDYLGRIPGNRKLLLVLTDGAPMDERAFPPEAGGSLAHHEYIGKAAVRDAAAEVRALRAAGIAVAGLFNGEDGQLRDAKLMFGDSLARIRHLNRMADAASQLIVGTVRT